MPFTQGEKTHSTVAAGFTIPRAEDVLSIVDEVELLQHLEDELWVLGADMQLLYVNRPDREDLLGTSALELLPADARENFRSMFALALQSGIAQVCQVAGPDDTWSRSRLVPLTGRRGARNMLVTTRDITARRRLEVANTEIEMRLTSALEAGGVGSWSWSVLTGEVVWDDRVREIAGQAVRPESYADYLESVHPEDLDLVKTAVEGSLISGHFEELENRIVRPSGEVRHILSRAIVVVDADGTTIGLRGGVFDITERKLLEERLRNEERMGAMGRLSAGIAHNFNNLLGIIIPNVELCRGAAADVAARHLDDIEEAAARAADMIRQLTQFGRHELGAPKRPVELQTVVNRLLSLCRSTFDPRIAIECVMPAEPSLSVIATAGEIEQVLLSVCINARDALTSVQLKSAMIRFEVGPGSAGFMRVRISDNGPGMHSEVSACIFEPFFTTKGIGGGAGLSLASAYGIVCDHGGTITCDSEPGRGTAFTIELPAAPEAALEEPRKSVSTPAVANTETVLLIDDEFALRRVFRIILEQAGFNVLEAPDGVAGLELIVSRGQEIDLVLLDRSMPRMSGEQVLLEMRRQNIHMPVIILTGYEGKEAAHETAAAVLLKPVVTGELVATIRSVLDRRPTRRQHV